MSDAGVSVDEKVLEPGEAPSFAALVSQLTADAREVARAEVALQKAKIGEALGRYRAAIAFFAVAGVLALGALIALLVGLVIALATLVGPWLATLIVVGVTLLVAGVLALVGKARLTARRAS